MKKYLGILFSLLMISSSAFADIRVDLNGSAQSLRECGGTIQAKSTAQGAGQSDQVNLILRGVEQCSNFIIDTTSQEYKLQDQGGKRGGAYTISAGRLSFGWNQIALTVRSNSGKHYDRVSIWVNVVPKQSGPNACLDEAQSAGLRRANRDYNAYSASARYDRTSNKGNYVYSVDVFTSSGRAIMEVVTDSSCNVLSADYAR